MCRKPVYMLISYLKSYAVTTIGGYVLCFEKKLGNWFPGIYFEMERWEGLDLLKERFAKLSIDNGGADYVKQTVRL